MSATDHDYDVLIIGSGFGGSVSALRLTEKGYRVGVLEAGRRFADADFAKTSWRLRDYLYAPSAPARSCARRAGTGDVAQQGRAGSPARTRNALPPGRAGTPVASGRARGRAG
jgi:cholesterol oxidase